MTFFLSKLELNLRSRKVRRDLQNPYELHRTLSRGVEHDGDERALWRVEGEDSPAVLVQTRREPDWAYLSEEVPPTYLLSPAETKAVDLRLRAGQSLYYRLRANPTRKSTVGGAKKRLALYDLESQLAWLRRKATASGFTLLSTTVVSEDTLEFKHGVSQVKLHVVTFEGTIRVVEPERLARVVSAGIGSAKGFGMGLLSLGPAQ